MSIVTLIAVLVVLLVVNLLNHRWRSHWYLRTCITGAALMLVIGRLSGFSWTEMGLGRSAIVSGIVWGTASIAVVVVVYLIGMRIPRTRGFFVDDRLGGRSGFAVARHALVEVPLGTVLLEETAFRGVLFADLVIATDTTTAVIISSLIFGVWHVLPALTWHESNAGIAETLGERHERSRWLVVVLTVVGTAGAGVVFCLLLLGSNSLLAPMGFHWAVNGLGLFFVWWLRRR